MNPSKCDEAQRAVPYQVNAECNQLGRPGGYSPVLDLDNQLGNAQRELEAMKREQVRLQHVDENTTCQAVTYTPEGHFGFLVPKQLVLQAMEKEIVMLKARVARFRKASLAAHALAIRVLQPAKAK